jgi:hypothetical protein
MLLAILLILIFLDGKILHCLILLQTWHVISKVIGYGWLYLSTNAIIVDCKKTKENHLSTYERGAHCKVSGLKGTLLALQPLV